MSASAPAPFGAESFFDGELLDVALCGAKLSQNDKGEPRLRLDFRLDVTPALAERLPLNLLAAYESFSDPATTRHDLATGFPARTAELYQTERKRQDLTAPFVTLFRFRFQRKLPGGAIWLEFSFECDPQEVSNFWATHFGHQMTLKVERVQRILPGGGE